MARWTKIGIVAGGGKLPIRLVQACEHAGTPYFVVRLSGMADRALDESPGETISIGEAGRIFSNLHNNGCDGVVLVGLVKRPDFSRLKPDWRGAALLPKLAGAALKGDGEILSVLVESFEAEGFLVIGADEILKTETAAQGCLGTVVPHRDDFLDIVKARKIVEALGPFDIGQGAVVLGGQVLAIEAAEGTDAMLDRCVAIRRDLDLYERGGVLVKLPKPGQELRIDLPTIGPETVRRAAQANLAGISIAQGAALIIDRDEAIQTANEAGLFLYGFMPNDPNLNSGSNAGSQ